MDQQCQFFVLMVLQNKVIYVGCYKVGSGGARYSYRAHLTCLPLVPCKEHMTLATKNLKEDKALFVSQVKIAGPGHRLFEEQCVE